MHLRRSLALAAGALLLAPALSSCATNATDRINTLAAGVQNREADVDVLGATIVSAEPGSGTFIASFANNTEEDASVTSITGGDPAGLTFDSPSIEIPPLGMVNLATEGGLAVQGDFEAGDFVPIVVELGDGTRVNMDIPVVTNCDIWEGLDGHDTTQCEATEESH